VLVAGAVFPTILTPTFVVVVVVVVVVVDVVCVM